MSTTLNRASYSVVLVGATGGLGNEVANVFLSSYKAFFSRIVVTSRDTTTPAAKALAANGAELVQIDPANALASFHSVFKGVDVVVNLLGETPIEFRDAVAEAAVKNGVKVYFPAEYGSDYRINNFPGWDYHGWLLKGEHVRKYRELGAGKTKVITLCTGFFLENLFGKAGNRFGFDTANLKYSCIGSPDARTAITAKADIGRAIAELSLLSLNPATTSRVPDDVYIAGNNVGYRDIGRIVQKVRDELGVEPRGEITVESWITVEAFRENLRKEYLEKPKGGAGGHIKSLIAEGKMDFSKNDNELVNPGQSIWRWKTVEDHVREIGGKSFC